MNKKVGRNDPCSCGSGKKYKNCCLLKENRKSSPLKIKAVWVNQPKHSPESSETTEPVNLIERTYGTAISAANNPTPPSPKHTPEPTQE